VKNIILAAATVLSLGVGSSYAATQGQEGNSQPNNAAVAPTTITAIHTTGYHFPNPWDGTESWQQWNQDHPVEVDSGGGGG